MQNKGGGIQRPDFRDGQIVSARSSEKSLLVVGSLLLGAIAVGTAGGWFFSSQTFSSDPSVPVIAEILPQDIPDAIGTLTPTAQQTAQADSRECRFPMGFITAATPGNPAGGDVIFRTSKYRSPPFHVTDKPQRIAIPNPLPETGGVDLLSADGEAKGLMVSLTPIARMEPVNGTSAVKVIWHRRPACKT
ncbi:hypothetical protein [Bradyrhizobium sp. WSM2254]|uniref:hypothetical protein n=1 Tax=Bradyrhizobium sp. WSM2254 TaxID=1188263 RepID=UPI0004865089|nr:hypothetical protein [Bradyrhizobium sp. WSM2254]